MLGLGELVLGQQAIALVYQRGSLRTYDTIP